MDPRFVACVRPSKDVLIARVSGDAPSEDGLRLECSSLATELGLSVGSVDVDLCVPAEELMPATGMGGVLLPVQLFGNHAASMPCNFTPAWLPVGLQIAGRSFERAASFNGIRTVPVLSRQTLAARPWMTSEKRRLFVH